MHKHESKKTNRFRFSEAETKRSYQGNYVEPPQICHLCVEPVTSLSTVTYEACEWIVPDVLQVQVVSFTVTSWSITHFTIEKHRASSNKRYRAPVADFVSALNSGLPKSIILQWNGSKWVQSTVANWGPHSIANTEELVSGSWTSVANMSLEQHVEDNYPNHLEIQPTCVSGNKIEIRGQFGLCDTYPYQQPATYQNAFLLRPGVSLSKITNDLTFAGDWTDSEWREPTGSFTAVNRFGVAIATATVSLRIRGVP